MKLARLSCFAAALLMAAMPAIAAPRNIVIFVADGLRYDSVTPESAPTMFKLKKMGVDFVNSHSIYPTVTTANASAIATGHYLGDTGDYGNTLFTDFPVPCRFGATVTFLEDDCILRDMKDHFHDGYMGQSTLISAAQAAAYNTVIVGKKGPAALQNLASLDSKGARVDDPLGIFIDDATNRPTNIDGTPTKSTVLRGGLGADVFAATGEAQPAFSSTPNLVQQAYLLSAATQVLIPGLKDSGKLDRGDLFDFAVRIKLSPALYAAAQKLSNHQASDPIEENGELHVLLMDKRQAPPERSFAEARDAVLQDFKKDEQTRVENANLTYLKSKADVQLAPEFRQ